MLVRVATTGMLIWALLAVIVGAPMCCVSGMLFNGVASCCHVGSVDAGAEADGDHDASPSAVASLPVSESEGCCCCKHTAATPYTIAPVPADPADQKADPARPEYAPCPSLIAGFRDLGRDHPVAFDAPVFDSPPLIGLVYGEPTVLVVRRPSIWPPPELRSRSVAAAGCTLPMIC